MVIACSNITALEVCGLVSSFVFLLLRMHPQYAADAVAAPASTPTRTSTDTPAPTALLLLLLAAAAATCQQRLRFGF